MKNTKSGKRVIACGIASVFALAFVAAAISGDNASLLPATFVQAFEGVSTTSSGDQTTNESFQNSELSLPLPNENYLDDYEIPDINWETGESSMIVEPESDQFHNSPSSDDGYNEYNQHEDEWEDDYSDYENDRWEDDENDILREVENRSRDLQHLKRQARKNPALSPLISQIESKMQAVKNCVNSTTSSDREMDKCWNIFEDLDSLFEQANLAEDSVHLQRELKDFNRIEIRELAKLEKEGVDVGGLRIELSKMKNLTEQMLKATDIEIREDLRWEKEDLSEEFWEKLETAQHMREFARLSKECDKNVKREVERAKKELSRDGKQDPAIISQLNGLVQTCHKIVADAKMKKDVEYFIDSWEIDEMMREHVWEKLEKLTRSFHENRMCEDIERGAKELEKGITIEAPRILENAPESVKPKLVALIEKGKHILVEIKGALGTESCEKAARIMEDAENLQWEFEEIMDEIGFDEGLIDYDKDYEEMYADFEDVDFDVDKDEFKKFMIEKRFGLGEMNRMKKLSKEVLAEYVERNLDTEDRTLQFANNADLDNTKLQALIQAKNDLTAEVDALRSQVTNLKQEIRNITAELTEYNFGIGAAKDEAKTLASRLSTLDENEARAEFNRIKKKAIEQKVTDGIIGFKDADDTKDNWFAPFALKAKNKGLIKGNPDGTLNPGGNLNYSEAAVAFGRIAGLNGQNSNSLVAGNLADWAEEGVAALEEKGVDLDFMSHVDAGDSIKREEVAVLLNEVLKLEIVSIDETDFADLDTASDREKQAIANVNAAGIMTGKGGSDEFGVDEELSRAALTKVLNLATEQTE